MMQTQTQTQTQGDMQRMSWCRACHGGIHIQRSMFDKSHLGHEHVDLLRRQVGVAQIDALHCVHLFEHQATSARKVQVKTGRRRTRWWR